MGKSLTEIVFTEYAVKVLINGKEVKICGLCGNNGVVETNPKTSLGMEIKIKTYCICPNGRRMKRMKFKID